MLKIRKYIEEYIGELKINWQNGWMDKSFRKQFIITLVVTLAINWAYTIFLKGVEVRQGVILNDPILGYFQAIDLSVFIFVVLMSTLAVGFLFFIQDPRLLSLAWMSFAFFVGYRIVAMYLAPFDPPRGMIYLKDPIAELVISSGQLPPARDLFYSGHTGDMFLLALVSQKKWLKWLAFFVTLVIGVSVLLQKVHYSLDVYAAPFFAYCAYRSAKYILFKIAR